MAPTPILEMARAYGLHPRLWLLILLIISELIAFVIRHTDRPLKNTGVLLALLIKYRKQHVAKNAIIFYVQEINSGETIW